MPYSQDIDNIQNLIASTHQKLTGVANKIIKQKKLSIEDQSLLELVDRLISNHNTQMDLLKNVELNNVVANTKDFSFMLFSVALIIITILSFIMGMQIAFRIL